MVPASRSWAKGSWGARRSGSTGRGRSTSARLSKREIEVLRLVAEGRTNGEIGRALFVTTKTASSHVAHILDKLGVSSRTEAAIVAERLGLLRDPATPAT